MKQTVNTIIDFRNSLALWVMLVLFIPLWAGCLGDSAQSEAMNDSSADGDTPADGDTMADGDLNGVVSIEVVPNPESGLPTQQFLDIDLDTFDGRLTLVPAVRFSGEVRDPDNLPAGATVTLIPAESTEMIIGHPLPSLSATTTEGEMRRLAQADSPAQAFTLSGTPALYSLYIFPSDETSWPPVIRHDLIDLTDGTAVNDVFSFERGLSVQGRVVNADGEGLSEVRVTAYDVDVWKRANVVYSDGNGYFTLRLSTDDGNYLLEYGGEQYPKIQLENAVTVSGKAIEQLSPNNGHNEWEVAFTPFHGGICRSSGQVVGGDDAGVAKAKLNFSALIGGGEFETGTTADDEGRFTLDLLRTWTDITTDTYRVTVVPPTDNAFGIAEFTLDCDSESVTDVEYKLGNRLLLSGVVKDGSGRPVADTVVDVQKKPTVDDSIAYVKSTTSDSNGRYEVAVDPGIYDLVFKPPMESGLARSELRGLQTSTDATIDQVLAQGQRLTGQVVDIEGEAAPWSLIQVYRERPTSGLSELIGSGSCDATGNYELILP